MYNNSNEVLRTYSKYLTPRDRSFLVSVSPWWSLTPKQAAVVREIHRLAKVRRSRHRAQRIIW